MCPRLPALVTALMGLPLAAAAPAGGQRAERARAAKATGEAGTVLIPAGRYLPPCASGADSAGVDVAAFRMDVRPVTVAGLDTDLQPIVEALRRLVPADPHT